MTVANKSNSEDFSFADLVQLNTEFLALQDKVISEKEFANYEHYSELDSYLPKAEEIIAPYLNKNIYVAEIDYEANWQSDKPYTSMALLGLSMGEARARAALMGNPNPINPYAITIKELMELPGMLSRLALRLENLTPYALEQIPEKPEWLWTFIDGVHWRLLLVGARIILPDSLEDTEHRFSKLIRDETVFTVTNKNGLFGIASADGELLQECRFSYLKGPISPWGTESVFFEYADENPPVLCDLADETWQQINPMSVKVIPESESYDIWQVVDAEKGINGLRGYMNHKGELLGSRCWRQARGHWDMPKRAAVQDDATGLWGYVDIRGEVVISPQYINVGTFNDKRAFVTTENGVGVIDPDGNTIIESNWRRINWFKQDDFVVENDDLKLAIFDIDGKVVLDFQEWPHIEDIDKRIFEYPISEDKEELKIKLDQERYNRWPDEVRNPTKLDVIAKLPVNEIHDICHGLLWGNRVELLEPCEVLGIQMEKGEQGIIYYQYPASAGMFDFSVEVPVSFFKFSGKYSGVPWHLLKMAESSQSLKAKSPLAKVMNLIKGFLRLDKRPAK